MKANAQYSEDRVATTDRGTDDDTVKLRDRRRGNNSVSTDDCEVRFDLGLVSMHILLGMKLKTRQTFTCSTFTPRSPVQHQRKFI